MGDRSRTENGIITGDIGDRRASYQGLGQGLEADAAGLRCVVDASDTALITYSCDKNFGLYRDRVGALFVKADGRIEAVRSNLLMLARCLWSMPPDHGAAVQGLSTFSSS